MTKSAQTSAMRRINELLDDNSFVEVGAYMTARSTDFNMQAQETPADGVVTGYGTVEGALVYVYSQDAAVMGGSGGRPDRLCRLKASGRSGRIKRVRKTVRMPDPGFRRDPADPGSVRKLRRRYGSGFCNG